MISAARLYIICKNWKSYIEHKPNNYLCELMFEDQNTPAVRRVWEDKAEEINKLFEFEER